MAKGKRKRKDKKQFDDYKGDQPSTTLQDQTQRSIETPSTSNAERTLQPVERSIMSQDTGLQPEEAGVEHSSKDIRIEFPDAMVLTENLPPKQDPGILGKRIKLIANWFPIELLPSGNIYHYDVKIINIKRNEESDLSICTVDEEIKKYRCLSTKLNRKVIHEMLRTDSNLKNSYAVYDGKYNLYTPALLNLKFPYQYRVVIQNKNKIDSNQDNEHDVFEVTIKPVEKKDENNMKIKSCAISLEPLHHLFHEKKYNVDDIQAAIMALEIVFRHTPAMKYVPIGRSFFHPTFNLENMHPLSEGIQIWFGYHQSLPLGQFKPMVNLDMTATTFFAKNPLLKYIAEYFDMKNVKQLQNKIMQEREIKNLSKVLKNVEVEVTHQAYRRKYRIVKLTKESADKLEFLNEEKNKTVKLIDYFKETYKTLLQYPHLPCIQVKPEKKKIYMPFEVCEITEGNHYRAELKKKHSAQMIKVTAQAPKDRFDRINVIRDTYTNYDHDEYLNRFNITVGQEPIHLEGRVLHTPNIKYSNVKIKPKNGMWDIRDKKFIEGAEINSLCLLSLANERDCSRFDLANFLKQLHKISKAAGMKLEESFTIDIISENDIRKKFRDVKCKNISLTVVVIPFKNKSLYKTVKQTAEVEFGIITQCISHENIKNCNASLLSNLCQKINAKMGGINHILTESEIPSVFEKPVIIIGADVSHAKVTDKNGISIAAVVGSLHRDLTKFAVTCKLQKNKNDKKKSLEIIVGLKDMVKDLLKAFYSRTRLKPEKIIFYRDGVSEGQFAEVKEKEVQFIRDAWYELEKQFKPAPITYAVVQKRHHTRLIPENIRDGVGYMKNVEPGTVVDTDIVHPLHRDFYLCSQNGIKGTSRPGHYTIIEDENGFTADNFQKLTYYLCHTFVRCSKSISCPAPVRYAHLAAHHTRLYLPSEDKVEQRQHVDSNKAHSESQEISKEILKAIQIPNEIKHTMYFV